jgi:hypothetical protein
MHTSAAQASRILSEINERSNQFKKLFIKAPKSFLLFLMPEALSGAICSPLDNHSLK